MVIDKELAHAVGCMASHALKRPLRSLEISKRVLKYLARTVEYGILSQEVDDDPLLAVYSDVSFAPGGGRSFGSTMAQIYRMPVAWRAPKQPVITLSVAEAELYEGCSAVQSGLGIDALHSELSLYPVMHLRIDNAAAQGLASEAPGTWKTRHLRIRARFLRQEVAAQRLVISHVCGSMQKADLGTKGFDLPKFKSLLADCSMCSQGGYQRSIAGFEGDQLQWMAVIRGYMLVPYKGGGCWKGGIAFGWIRGVLCRGHQRGGGGCGPVGVL